MKRCRLLSAVAVILFLAGGRAYGQGSSVSTPPQAGGTERATWRLEIDNDVFFNSDNNISSGLSLQRHTAGADRWEEVADMPKFVRRLGQNIPTLTGKGLIYRVGVAIGQVIQTPTDLLRRDLIKEDVPYAGVFTLQASWYAYNDDEFRGFEITTGVVGPLSLAGEYQKAFHKLIRCVVPQGWDNQLANELLINLNYMRKEKVWRGGRAEGVSFDAAVNGDVALGSLFTQASVALETRVGRNMPGGFVSMSDPTGFSLSHMATLNPARPGAGSFYGSLVLRGTVLAHTLFLDGNTFRASHRVDRKPLVGQIIAGLHYERRHWGIGFYAMASSAVVNTRKAPAAESRERVGAINIEWRL